jgi:hypothetical protein
MDPAAISTAVVSILSPFLGEFLRAGGKLASGAGAAAAGQAGEAIEGIWDALFPWLKDRPGALEAAKDVARTPDDELSTQGFTIEVQKVLRDNPDLARQVAALIAEVEAKGGGDRVNIGRAYAPGGVVAGVIKGNAKVKANYNPRKPSS